MICSATTCRPRTRTRCHAGLSRGQRVHANYKRLPVWTMVEECGGSEGVDGIRYSKEVLPATFLFLAIGAGGFLKVSDSAVKLVGDGVSYALSGLLLPNTFNALVDVEVVVVHVELYVEAILAMLELAFEEGGGLDQARHKSLGLRVYLSVSTTRVWVNGLLWPLRIRGAHASLAREEFVRVNGLVKPTWLLPH